MQATNQLRKHALGLMALLVVLYLLGMLTNLFVHFPEGNTDLQQWDYAKSNLLVMSHIVLGVLLLFGSLALLVRTIRAKDRAWRISAGFGFGSIILAVVSGSEFVSTQNEVYSLAMSVFFVGALASYGWGVYRSRV